MSHYRSPTRDGIRACDCGCGLTAKRYVSGGRFKGWRKYAAGHAPNERVVVKVPGRSEDLAYAAGILDGEGCIWTRIVPYKGHNNTTIQVQVTMCSPEVVKWLVDSFGGSVYSDQPPGRQVRYSWQVRGSKVGPLLSALLPYLKEKRERAKLAIQMADMMKRTRFQKLPSEEVAERKQIAALIKGMNRNPHGETELVQ